MSQQSVCYSICVPLTLLFVECSVKPHTFCCDGVYMYQLMLPTQLCVPIFELLFLKDIMKFVHKKEGIAPRGNTTIKCQ